MRDAVASGLCVRFGVIQSLGGRTDGIMGRIL